MSGGKVGAFIPSVGPESIAPLVNGQHCTTRQTIDAVDTRNFAFVRNRISQQGSFCFPWPAVDAITAVNQRKNSMSRDEFSGSSR